MVSYHDMVLIWYHTMVWYIPWYILIWYHACARPRQVTVVGARSHGFLLEACQVSYWHHLLSQSNGGDGFFVRGVDPLSSLFPPLPPPAAAALPHQYLATIFE